MSGWVKTYRSLVNWAWATSPNHLSVFMHLLLRANYKQTKWRNETIMPGEILTGRKQISVWTGLSEQKIRTVLRDLKSTNEITIKSSNKFSVISINNWEIYQGDIDEKQLNQPATQPSINQQSTTSKKVKKERKDNIPQIDFDSFYSGYPRKEGKKKGKLKFEKQITSQEKYDRICIALENYKQLLRDEGRSRSYTKSFEAFMNNWEDYEDYKSEKAEANEKLTEMLRW